MTAGLVALMLSALLMLTESFAASMPLAQRALSVLLLAFGCSQLIKGPLSDHFDRRPTSLCGLLACECTAPVKAAAR